MKMYHVMPQTSMLLKLLIVAELTLELVHIAMDVGMGLHVALLGELLSANFAFVNLDRFTNNRIVRVFLRLVDHQVDLLVEDLITDDAFDFSLDGVGGQVPHKRSFGVEFSIANFTPILLHPAVKSLVHPQTVVVLEGLAANIAREHGLLVSCLVRPKGTGISKSRRTLVALEWFVVLVLAGVHLEVLAVLELLPAERTD